jgi:hypothetical protein
MMIRLTVFSLTSSKYLEHILVHLAMTFEFVKPYLKGLHLSLAYHLGKRGKLGWKRWERDWINYVSHQGESGGMTQDEAFQALHPPDFDDKQTPSNVSPLQRMREDFAPPLVLLRCAKVLYILYGFAVASGSAFGSSFQLSDGLSLRINTCGKDDEDNSSSWREFENVVEALEDQVEKGTLEDSVVYLATKNSTVSRSSRGKWNIFELKAAQLSGAPSQGRSHDRLQSVVVSRIW